MRGDFHASSANRPKHMGRWRFLLLIEELSPATWDSLREDVLPLYEHSVWQAEVSELGSPEALECGRAIQAWHVRWRLHDEWLRPVVSWALHLWAEYGSEEPVFMAWVQIENFQALLAEDQVVDNLTTAPPSFDSEAWNPTRERWVDFQKRALDRVRQDLTNYRRKVEDQDGLTKWRKKRRRADREPDQHMKWLVRFQVLGESHQSIADDPLGDGNGRRVEVRTVEDAIRSTAELIGLTRRSLPTHE